MVLKYYNRKCRIATIILVMVVLFSCEESRLSPGFCATCLPDKPENGTLEISLKKVFSDQTVRIRIYEGNFEDSLLLATWITAEANTSWNVSLNKSYTLTASYYFNGSTYIAVNSVFPRVKYDETTCDEPCYYVYDKKVNLRLKWSK